MARPLHLAVALLCAACTQSAQTVSQQACAEEDECDLTSAGGSAVTLSPAQWVIHERIGITPRTMNLAVNNATAAPIAVTIACGPRAQVMPAAGTIPANGKLWFNVQVPTQSVTGTHLEGCEVKDATGVVVAKFIASVTFAGKPVEPPGGGPIGPTGGSVDLLDFTLTGDTRPAHCNAVDQYPAATHAQIIAAMGTFKPQFGIDLGDHMFACNETAALTAQPQMDLYLKGLEGFPASFFMTMGNHECIWGADCSTRPDDPNYKAFSAALLKISKQSKPNYALQIQTRKGRVTVVIVADNYFGAPEKTWLEATLTDADAKSVATIVAKHHPVTGSRTGPPGPWQVIQGHKYTLILSAHDHSYSHEPTAFAGRTVICGLGGANPNNTGFCRVQQGDDGKFRFTAYDATGNPGDTWSVDPQ